MISFLFRDVKDNPFFSLSLLSPQPPYCPPPLPPPAHLMQLKSGSLAFDPLRRDESGSAEGEGARIPECCLFPER